MKYGLSKIYLNLFLFAFHFFNIQSIDIAPSNLLFVYSHFRHGSRTSTHLNKKGQDYFDISHIGVGELNSVGSRMHYLVGLRNRIRYQNFLSKQYDPREVCIYSTNTNRTLSSAISQISGLYTSEEIDTEALNRTIPPLLINESPEVIENLTSNLGNFSNPGKMQVIPLHSTGDYTRYECKSLDNYKNNSLKEVDDFVDKFNNLYERRLRSLFGLEQGFLFRIKNIVTICDQFISSLYEHGNKNVEILEKLFIDLKEFEGICIEAIKVKYRYYDWGDKDYIGPIVSSSRLVRDMISMMEKKVNDDINNITDFSKYTYDDYSRPKLFLLSGHESTLTPLQLFLTKALNIEDYYYCDFASNMFFELYRDKNKTKGDYSDYYVEYYYDDKMVKRWNFDEFRNKILENSWDEDKINEFCGVESNKKDESKSTWFYILVSGLPLLIIILILIGVIIYLLKKHKEIGLKPLINTSDFEERTD